MEEKLQSTERAEYTPSAPKQQEALFTVGRGRMVVMRCRLSLLSFACQL